MGRSWSRADALDQVPVFTPPLPVWPAPNSTSEGGTAPVRGDFMFRTATIALLVAMFMAASGGGGGNPNLTPPSGGGDGGQPTGAAFVFVSNSGSDSVSGFAIEIGRA